MNPAGDTRMDPEVIKREGVMDPELVKKGIAIRREELVRDSKHEHANARFDQNKTRTWFRCRFIVPGYSYSNYDW